MSEAYRVDVDKKGCAHCSAGTFWTVVGPGDIAIGTSWADEETANDIADLMNMAYDAALERTPPEAPLKILLEALDDFQSARQELAWNCPAMTTAANELSDALKDYKASTVSPLARKPEEKP